MNSNVHTPVIAEVVLAQPRGFCAGVERAIATVEHALAKFGAPVYVLHEIVHNTHVVATLAQRGVIFVEDLSEVPQGETLIFSAHGVSRHVAQTAHARGLRVFDATCPLVSKIHVEVAKLAKEGYEFILIGHKNHPEIKGTMGQLTDGVYLVESLADLAAVSLRQTQKIALITQTTLSVDDAAQLAAAARARFPTLREPKQQDICYATQNRQNAVKQLTGEVDIVLVVGSPSSSNSVRLVETARRCGVAAFMIDTVQDIDPSWFVPGARVGLTAGASAPEVLLQEVVQRLKSYGCAAVRKFKGVQETIRFPLPSGLRLPAP